MDSHDNLAAVIEALLFVAGEPIPIDKLAELSSSSAAEVQRAVQKLQEAASMRGGIRVLEHDHTISLVTAPHLAPYVEKLIKEEILGDLSKASLETLTVIAYHHPLSRPEIDYIRGVNSSFTLRNLMARGLVERMEARHGRSHTYQPTVEFMKYLGLSSFSDLPEYNVIRRDIAKGIEKVLENEA
ncbi:MAG: segregation and condensation protein B [Parcubacteria group bacterium Gr01-1014_29]|nr:MAG: segregation and condensation protein B [Parcubacteria group bacterium Gr01-1014_29]